MAAETGAAPLMALLQRQKVIAGPAADYGAAYTADSEGSQGAGRLELRWLPGGSLLKVCSSWASCEWSPDAPAGWDVWSVEHFRDVCDALDAAARVRHETHPLADVLPLVREAAHAEGAPPGCPYCAVSSWRELQDLVEAGAAAPAEIERLYKKGRAAYEAERDA